MGITSRGSVMDRAIFIIGDLIDATPKDSVVYVLAVIGGCWIMNKTWKFLLAGGVLFLGARLWIGN